MFNGFSIPVFQGDIGQMTKKKMTKYENSRTFMMVLMRLIDMALDYRYHFEGLPDTMDERVIKQSLLFYGNVTIFDLDGVPIGLPSAPDGKAYDVYGNAGSSYVFSKNGRINFSVPLHYKYSDSSLSDKKLLLGSVTKNAKVENGVVIWERKTRMPFIWTVIYYAERIADTLRTLDLDRRWLKRPFIPRCEESEGKSFDESLKSFMSNEDFNVSLKSRNLDKTDIFQVDLAPEVITHVTQLVEWYESQFKIICGIDSNTQVDKKGENLISDEVNIDQMYGDMAVDSIIEYMNEQLDIYNGLTGSGIHCKMNMTKEKEEAQDENDDISRDDRDRGDSLS